MYSELVKAGGEYTLMEATVSVDRDASSEVNKTQSAPVATSPYQQHHSRLRAASLRRNTENNDKLRSHAIYSAQHSRPLLALWNIYSVIKLYGAKLISIESIFGSLLTVGVTLAVYYNVEDSFEDGNTEWNGHLPTTLISFAVITPLSDSIVMAFNRRERALQMLASYRSAAYQLYVAHTCWDWAESQKKAGRRGCKEDKAVQGKSAAQHASEGEEDDRYIDFQKHADTTLSYLIHLNDALFNYLTLPSATRTRHRATSAGRREAAEVSAVGRAIFKELYGHMTVLSQQTEALKYRGMPGNEASRVRQWEDRITNAIEDLRVVKEYRTLQALRVFGRLFSIFMPPLYATTYVQVAFDSGSLALGILIGAFHSLILTGLFNCVAELEDPFVASRNLDGIDCREELIVLAYEELMSAREMMYPEAEKFVLKKDCFEGDFGGKNVVQDRDRKSRHALYPRAPDF